MAKKQPQVSKIYSIELNPDAHHFAEANVVLNKLQGKVEAILMDAVVACNTVSSLLSPHFSSIHLPYFDGVQILKGICDRVCLPVPKEISFFYCI